MEKTQSTVDTLISIISYFCFFLHMLRTCDFVPHKICLSVSISSYW
ncbi:hypothetical protein BVRB_4g087350 [Beta vulgaris subsp. vulgaris]|nr:hypothetical protein BVRB_4g087350 [Beta vulgaris subsp. vulgaris]